MFIGGLATNHQILSAESQKYFRNAIVMSGSVLKFASMATVENHLSHTYKMAEEFGEPKESIEDLVEFLKTISAKKLNDYAQISHTHTSILYAPVVESMHDCINLESNRFNDEHSNFLIKRCSATFYGEIAGGVVRNIKTRARCNVYHQ